MNVKSVSDRSPVGAAIAAVEFMDRRHIPLAALRLAYIIFRALLRMLLAYGHNSATLIAFGNVGSLA